MGQRTFILVRKKFLNPQSMEEQSTISLIHHQWGYRKTMLAMFLQELLNLHYNMDRSLTNKLGDSRYYEGGKDIMVNHVFNFYPLNSAEDSYIFEQPSDPKEDIFNTDVIQKYASMTDNNNGGMIIDVIQQYTNKVEPRYYGNCVKVRIGFVLGGEEEDFYSKKINGYIPIERAFERLVSPYEYVKKTSYIDYYEEDLFFAKTFVSLCNFFGVEMKYSKKKALAIHKKEKHIESVINALTKNLPEGSMIDVPKELLNLGKGYAYR